MSEVWTVFYLTTFYFLVGALGMFFINRKNRDGAAARWRKLIVYAFIVYAVQSSIVYVRPFPYICAALLLGGVNELIFVWRWHPSHKWWVLILAFAFFIPVGYAFFYFAMDFSWYGQLFIYMIVLTFDGFSQVAGQLIGKHKLFPSVSPNKTVEGTLGGIVMALVTAYILKDMLTYTFNDLLLLTALTCAVALAGDLLASWYKRVHNVKDYSSIIPGHGGVLDRFDSFIFAGAAWWVANHFGLLDRF
jgi:phosphatidate cytidylyltransferase